MQGPLEIVYNGNVAGETFTGTGEIMGFSVPYNEVRLKSYVKAFLGLTTAFAAASVNAAPPASDPSEPSTAGDQTNDIIVEAQRLPEELKNTTLEFVRGREDRVTFKIRADGTFASSLRGVPSDFGVWRVEGDNVCFVGRMRGTFCGQALVNKRPGDTWKAVGYDGKIWKARLIDGD